MISPVSPAIYGETVIFDPVANAFLNGDFTLAYDSTTDEETWVKLPDSSILTIDGNFDSQRFIPSGGVGEWIPDAQVIVQGNPLQLYDAPLGEMGPGLLLPSGRAFFLGGTGHTAVYTPSGSSSPGSWANGVDIPNGKVIQDGSAAMLVNGRILCTVGTAGYVTNPTGTNSISIYPAPMWFYEYDPVANSFATNVASPGSPNVPGSTDNTQPYNSRMLVLPDGNVLFSDGGATVYIYQPDASLPALIAGKPGISSITANSDGSYHLTGTKLNGISQGASYGDDAQMDSNYPLVRLADGSGNVYYARTYNWSSTGVMTGDTPVTTEFALPTIALDNPGTYSLVVVANGIASDPISFTVPTSTWVDFNYSGAQNGSYSFPFSTLAQGVSAVLSGGTINIKGPGIDANNGPAVSHETMTISNAMTIRAIAGPATIGH